MVRRKISLRLEKGLQVQISSGRLTTRNMGDVCVMWTFSYRVGVCVCVYYVKVITQFARITQ